MKKRASSLRRLSAVWRRGCRMAAACVCAGACWCTIAGAVTAAPAPAAPPAASPPPAAASAPAAPSPLTASEVIAALDQTVNWYRTLGIQQQAANEPSDLLILYENRQTANQVIALAFDAARANAELLSRQPSTDQTPDDSLTSAQTLQQLRGRLHDQAVQVQAELDAKRGELRRATSKSRTGISAKIDELQGELDLIGTKQGILTTMTGLASGSGTGVPGSSALKAQIEAMAVAIPSANAGTPSSGGSSPPAAGGAASPAASAAASTPLSAVPLAAATPAVTVSTDRFGLWDLAENAFRLSEKADTITAIDRRTAQLQASLGKIRTPLIEQMKTLSARGDALAARADAADSSTLNGVRAQLEALAEQFKENSSLLIPLSRENVLLNQYRHNLGTWRDAVKSSYRDALQTLGIRVLILLIVLAFLFGAAELWHRAVLRYVRDYRRRHQLLLLRRIALWSLVVVVVGVAFASELGSVVTFAGLITAGIAVAMQSVLVSIVGYFFLIGKYGIRVGDRVQIGEVSGEVIDVGLVRLYLMELGAKGSLGPTGRVVAFANSVVFQVASGLFKQIPGVNFSWREVVLNLPAGVDYAAVKERLQAAVTDALAEYRPEILRQTQEIERTTLSSSGGDAEPQVQLRFSPTGVEAHVRYPVHLQHAAEIEEKVTRGLAQALHATAPAA